MNIVDTATDIGRRYCPLGVAHTTTPADFRSKPDQLFGPHDLAAAGIVGSRTGLHRALKRGRLPAPMRLASGRLVWYGRTISAYLDGLEHAAGERRAATNRTCEMQVTV
ncbi:helix-turn-helix transcriptional regulator [Reyranella sp.]|uniref:helix-turn-helix transcriptional regulator n=1 Tax=Reyranella sp. TaxID=1929291 RepID=UPI003D0B85F0